MSGQSVVADDCVLITVREPRGGGVYVARAQGMGVSASSTLGAEAAARACARKLYGEGFDLRQYGAAHTWVATPNSSLLTPHSTPQAASPQGGAA